MAITLLFGVCPCQPLTAQPPCGRPQNVQVVNMTHNQLTVRWTPQTGVSYDVFVYPANSFLTVLDQRINTVSGNEVTLPILEPCTNYVVRVVARCPCAGGFEAVEVPCSTLASVPSGLALQGQSFQQRTALPTWHADPNTLYDLRVTRPSNQVSVVSGVEPVYTLPNVDRCAITEVSLRARCPQGDRPSAYSAPVVIDQRPAQGCGTVAITQATRSGNGQVAVSWRATPPPRTWASSWQLEARPHGEARWSVVDSGSGVETQAARFSWPTAQALELRVVLSCCGDTRPSGVLVLYALPRPRPGRRFYRLPRLTY